PTPETLIGVIAVRDLGNLSVEIAHFGHAHTSSDLIIAVPDRNVVIVGDLVEAGPPQFDETTSIHGWVAALDCLHSILKPDMTVICGHGTPLTADHVTKFRAGLAAIWDQSEWAFNQGMSHAGAVKEFEWPWDTDTARKGVARAYEELKARPQPVLL
ncbi:MAG: hypothetical protein FWD55_04830, partial [Propionibacteriaceae bacterium]|nr:hypothetical protein [Propionibacteriaceae bacterium]